MPNTIDAYCRACKRDTYFCFDGEDWECQSCGRYNTNGDSGGSENPYGSIFED